MWVYAQLLRAYLTRMIVCNRVGSIFISNSIEVSALTFVKQMVWTRNALAFVLSLFAVLACSQEVCCLFLAVNVNPAIVVSACDPAKLAVLEVLGVI
jgi:hypothetical protein